MLILLPDQPGRPFTERILAGFRSVLLRQNSPSIGVFAQYSGASVNESPEVAAARAKWLEAKYRAQQFDVVVAIGAPSTELVRSFRDGLFKNAFVIYAIAEFEPRPAPISRSAGLIIGTSPQPTFQLARNLIPDAKYVVLWGGASRVDRAFAGGFLSYLETQTSGLEIVNLIGAPIAEVKDRMARLQPGGFAMILSEFEDRNGRPLDSGETIRLVSPVSPTPIFGASDVAMGEGLTGGSLIAWTAVGGELAQSALRALRDEAYRNSEPPTRPIPQTVSLDWRQLARYGIPLSRVPSGARVLYRPPSLLEQHRTEVTFGMAALGLQAVLIGGLLLERKRRRRIESLVRRNEAETAAMLTSVPGYIVMMDRRGIVLRTNQYLPQTNSAFDRFLASAIPGADYFRVFSGDEGTGQIADAVRRLATGEERELVLEQFRPGPGGGTWLEIRGEYLRNEHGGAVVAHLDVTAKKRAEIQAGSDREALSHLNRVAALGELTASLAHELNQPLTGILSNAEAAAQLLAMNPPDIAEAREAVVDIAEENRRASSIIKKMRQLMKKQETTLSPVSLNQAVRDVAGFLSSDAILRRVKIDLQLEEDLPFITADMTQLQQVVLNLMTNAMQAMDEQPESSRYMSLISRYYPEAAMVELQVRDHGRGIAPEDFSQMFEPFHTTKQEGLGIGLTICRSILDSFGGRIWAENAAAGGAIFHITLPVVAEQPLWGAASS